MSSSSFSSARSRLEPTHAGHDQIGDDDGRAEVRDLPQPFLTVGGVLGGVAPRPQQLGEAGTRRAVVLDDEHALAGRLDGLGSPDRVRVSSWFM